MRVLRLLRQPVPLAIWLGQLLSVTGDKLYAMALLWLVLQLTGSAKLMAAVSAAESVPYVLVGFLGAGLIVRSRKLRAMIKLDLLSAAVIAVIPQHWPDPPYLYQARRLRRRYRRVRAGLYAAAPAQRGAAGSARDR